MSRIFLTVADVAERWHCSQEHVRRLARAGELPNAGVLLKGYRFTEAAIEAYEQDAGLAARDAAAMRDAV